MDETWIPIIMFLSIAAILIAVFWFRYKARADMQSTLRSALDKGQELTPEIIDHLGHPKEQPNKDLRLGIIWMSLAVGLALCGFFVPDPSGHALQGCLAGAAFPFAIGVGYMIIHFFTRKDA